MNRSTHREPEKKPYTVTLWLTDAEARTLIEKARQVKAGKVRIVRSRTSAK